MNDKQELDPRGAALDGARQPAGAPLQMKAQRQRMDMAKRRQRDLAHRALADLGEDRVAQLVEALRHDPGGAIGEDHRDRHGDHGGVRRRRVGKRVDRVPCRRAGS